jgi:hypothetical protein
MLRKPKTSALRQNDTVSFCPHWYDRREHSWSMPD